MRSIDSGRRWTAVLAVLLAAGCAAPARRPPAAPEAAPGAVVEKHQLAQLAAYRAAVADAAVAEPDEVVHDLVAITPDNPALVWRPGPGGPQLLVVTWTDWGGYRGREGQEMTLGAYVWVTVAYQARDRCQTVDPDKLRLRLEQLLGLPPWAGTGRFFVEMWADPAQIFRPCPDTEIDDSTCGLGAPSAAPPAELVAFLWDQALGSYRLPDPGSLWPWSAWGFPWTHLGYTYDWGRHEGSEVGLSEFVVKKGAEVEIARVVETAEYCR